MKASSITLPGTRGEAVLLLHGLTGTPSELHHLADFINRDGYNVRVPLLPGRGERSCAMNHLSWNDWMRVALAEFDALAANFDRVIVGGLSAGATMTLDLATMRKPAALLLYAPVLLLRQRLAYTLPVTWHVLRHWKSPKSDMVGIGDSANASIYNPIPMRAVSELVLGMGAVRRKLGQINVPKLIVHSSQDSLVPLASAYMAVRETKGLSELHVLDGCGHAVTADVKRDEVVSLTRTFLSRNLAPVAITPLPQVSTLAPLLSFAN